MKQTAHNDIKVTDSVAWSKTELVGMRWLHLTGTRGAVFHLLGRLAATRIHDVMNEMPERMPLSQWFKSKKGEQSFASLLAESMKSHPQAMLELQELADGANIDPNILLEANLRGDVGSADGTGCSDVASKDGQSAFAAHNEDGAPNLRGKMLFLTLSILGEPTTTVQWYPGFLPCNSHVATSAGLVWGINHIQVNHPAVAEGRHFAAMALERVEGFGQARQFLNNARTAGGFSYNIGEMKTGRLLTAEVAQGQSLVQEIGNEQLSWHTNHLLHLPSAIDTSDTSSDAADSLGLRSESLERGSYLSHIDPPIQGKNDAQWYLDLLGDKPLPCGVRRFAQNNDPLMTLVTTICDLLNETVTLKSYDNKVQTLPFDEYVKVSERTAMEAAIKRS
ncbi:C45 family autoproteolytic acyltransferase/hydolase [Bifidobacterium aquikefiri]|uniref:C45 family autoproteolytic acyltransferase/hydolase n=1 Tax=Bifidobacterium aquikefiri TaxID=1653207 RepID=UPI0039E80675